MTQKSKYPYAFTCVYCHKKYTCAEVECCSNKLTLQAGGDICFDCYEYYLPRRMSTNPPTKK